jgi:hypothetical protein
MCACGNFLFGLGLLVTLSLLVCALVLSFLRQLGRSLAFVEFACVIKAFTPFALAPRTSKMVCTLQALHLSNLDLDLDLDSPSQTL